MCTTPAAPAGALNVYFQTDGSGNDYAYYIAPFDVPVFAPGLGMNNQKLTRLAMVHNITFPASATNSYAVASTNAYANTTFTLQRHVVRNLSVFGRHGSRCLHSGFGRKLRARRLVGDRRTRDSRCDLGRRRHHLVRIQNVVTERHGTVICPSS